MTALVDEKARARMLTNVIAVRLEPALYDRVDAAAAADKRTLSGWVRKLIMERLDNPGPTREQIVETVYGKTTGC